MGRSVTCNFQVQIATSGTTEEKITGAMTLKDIKGLLASEKEYQKEKGHAVVKMNIWPQTAAGRQYMKGKDFAIMDCWGNMDYYNVGDNIPIYTFE